jgi:hypothetical protein
MNPADGGENLLAGFVCGDLVLTVNVLLARDAHGERLGMVYEVSDLLPV